MQIDNNEELKIQKIDHHTVLIILDDVHLEGRPSEMQDSFFQTLKEKIDSFKNMNIQVILICAGDIGEADFGFRWAAQFNCQTIYVCGNHEFWGHDYYEVIEELTQLSIKPEFEHVHFLHNNSVEVYGIRFIGATLWTDLGLSWPWINKNQVLKYFLSMADFKRINANKFYDSQENIEKLKNLLIQNGIDSKKIDDVIEHKKFNPLLQISENRKSVKYIEKTLKEDFDGKTIVVSHHLPLPDFWIKKLGMPKDILNAENINNENTYTLYTTGKMTPEKDILMMGFYVNHLYHLFEQKFSPSIWIHGHFHQEVNDYIGRTRIVSSPVGYLKQSKEIIFKEINQNAYKRYMFKYIKAEIEKFKWNEEIIDTLRDLEKMILQFEPSIGIGLMTATDFKSIVTLYKKSHEDNLKNLKNKIGILFGIILQNIDVDVPYITDYYINNVVLGFDKWILKNSVKGKFPENIIFSVHETSFMSEEKFKIFHKNSSQHTHYKEWIRECQKIQIQISQYKRALLEFIDFLQLKYTKNV